MAKLTTTQKMVLAALGIAALAAALIYWLVAPLAEEDGIRVKSGTAITRDVAVTLETASGDGFEEDKDPEDVTGKGHKTARKWEKRCVAVNVTGGTCDVFSASHPAAAVDLIIADSAGSEYRSNLRVRGKKVTVWGGLWSGQNTLTHPGGLAVVEAFADDGKRTLRCTRADKQVMELALTRCMG